MNRIRCCTSLQGSGMSDSDSRPRAAAAAAGAFKAGLSHPACCFAVAAAAGGLSRFCAVASHKRKKEFPQNLSSAVKVIRASCGMTSFPVHPEEDGVAPDTKKSRWGRKSQPDKRKVCSLCFCFSLNFEEAQWQLAHQVVSPPSGQLLTLRLEFFSINKILCGNMWAESVSFWVFFKASAALVLAHKPQRLVC